MKKTVYQRPEIRDEHDNIIQEGTYGKESPLVNSTNDGVLDYINNNLEALHDNINGSRIYVANKAALPATGDLSAMYIAEDTGKWYLWDGSKYIETDNARKIADEALAARDAAKASQTAAKTSETNADASEQAAASSQAAAKTSEQNAGTQANTAKAWATATTSPDGAADTDSTTGKTQSAKSWALYSKDRAAASALSAKNAQSSEANAKKSESASATSATAAKGSEDKAKTSEVNAKASEVAAAESARQAAAGQINADWNETNADSKAFIKNKPEIYPNADKLDGYHETSFLRYRGTTTTNGEDTLWEQIGIKQYDNCLPEGISNTYTYGAVVSLPSGNFRFDIWYNHRSSSNGDGLWYRSGFVDDKQAWANLLDSNNYNNFIGATYARKDNASITNLTVTGESSVPTANEGNSSNAIASTEFVAKSLAKMVDSAPESLNTLNELAKALGNDPNFATTVINELAKKLNSTEAESTYATKQEAGVPYQIKRNTAYKVGDVLTSPSLPPGCVIIVTQAGTTGSTEPDWATIKSNMGG